MKKTTHHILITLIILFSMLLWPNPVSAQIGSVVQVDPISQAIDPGEGFSVDIMVLNVQDLFAFDVMIEFNPAYLAVTSVEWGSFLSPGLEIPGLIVDPEGTVQCGMSQQTPSLPQSGSGVLCTIYFSSKDLEGETIINISSVELVEGITYQLIPNTQQDGVVLIGEAKVDFPVYLPFIVNGSE